MRKAILFYSDCPFFAGCENMLANFMRSQLMYSNYSISFMYRQSEPYQKGIVKRINNKKVNYLPIILLKAEVHRELLKNINKGSFVYSFFAAIIILVWKYLTIIVSILPLYRVIKRKNIDILHINNGGFPGATSCYSMVIAAKLSGIKKIVYVVNNIAQDYKHPLRWLDYFLDLYLKKQISIFITGSKHAANELKKVLTLKNDQVINIPNGIELREINKSKSLFLSEIGIKKTNRLIFSVISILEKRKGHRFLLQAIAILSKTIHSNDMPLFIIEGSGSQKETIITFIEEKNLSSYVKLIGSINNIFDLYNASDVVVLPSIENEDFPNVIMEAMGMGKPIIGTKIAGIPEQIDNGVNGLLVEPADPVALAEAIKKMINRKRIQQFGKNAEIKYKKKYVVNKTINKYIKIYEKILKGEI